MVAYRAGGLRVRCCQGGDDGTLDVVGVKVGFDAGRLLFHDCCLPCVVVKCKIVLVGCVDFSGPGHLVGKYRSVGYYRSMTKYRLG